MCDRAPINLDGGVGDEPQAGLATRTGSVALPSREFLGDEFQLGQGGLSLFLPTIFDVDQLPPLREKVPTLVVEHVGVIA